jgi:hypothetical protein
MQVLLPGGDCIVLCIIAQVKFFECSYLLEEMVAAAHKVENFYVMLVDSICEHSFSMSFHSIACLLLETKEAHCKKGDLNLCSLQMMQAFMQDQ